MNVSFLFRYLLVGWAMVCTTGMRADDFNWFRVVSGGDTYEWPVGELRKVTFTIDGKMNVEGSGGTQVFDRLTLDKLYFAAQSTGIIAPDFSEDRIRLVSPMTIVFPKTSAGGRACICQSDGTLVQVVDVSPSGRQVSLEGLSRGVYVIRYAGQTLKFIRP